MLGNMFAVPELPTDKVKRCDQATGECEHVCEDTPSGIKCSCFDGFRAKGPSCIGNPYAHGHIQIHRCIFHIFIPFEEKSNSHTSLFLSLSLSLSLFYSTCDISVDILYEFAYRLRIDYPLVSIRYTRCFRRFPSTCQFFIHSVLYICEFMEFKNTSANNTRGVVEGR